MKITAIAPSNIAFIKYWGRRNEELRLPANSNISMNLSNLTTTTTVEFLPQYTADTCFINGTEVTGNIKQRVTDHINRMRKLAKVNTKARVVSQNNFPADTGLSSSASAFGSLSLALSKALGLNLPEKELSAVTRLASGSACRSIPSGFVQWLDDGKSDDSYAISLYPSDYWDLADVVVVFNEDKKKISTSLAQKSVFTSPFFTARLKNIQHKIVLLKQFLKDKDFSSLGQLVEDEALELHAIMMTSRPSLLYWYPDTVGMMQSVREWRRDGMAVYFTLNTGHNIHLLCEKRHLEGLLSCLKKVRGIQKIIINEPARGAHLISRHLF